MSTTPQLLIHISDPELGLLGYLAIDSFIGNRAYGGVRVKISDNARDGAHPEEAAHLAREMSLKFGFHEIPLGGTKSVIVLPPDLTREQRDRHFKAFGMRLGPLLKQNLVQTGLDMGMTGRDLHLFGQGAGLVPADSKTPLEEKENDSGRFTAIGLAQTFKTLRDFYSIDGRPLTCALEGFGSVGSYLAQCLDEMDAKIIAVSTLAGGLYRPDGLDVKQLITLRQEYGDEFVHHYADAQKMKREDLYAQKMDVLFPCGGLFAIHAGNAHQLQCRFVIAGANCAMDDACARILHHQEVGYIPGFVANAGSVLRRYVAKREKITRADVLEQRIRAVFAKRIRKLLAAAATGVPICDQAVRVACENIARMNEQQTLLQKTPLRRILSFLRGR